MRLTTILLLVTACGEQDVGIPDDWATEYIPQATFETSGDCGDALPYQWTTGGLKIDNPSPRPNEPEYWIRFEDGPRTTCETPHLTPPFTFTCTTQKHWVNMDERDCVGNADATSSGTFFGPREAEVDIV